jgi:hypothetical protein
LIRVIEEIDDGRCGSTILDRLPQALAGDDCGAPFIGDHREEAHPLPPDTRTFRRAGALSECGAGGSVQSTAVGIVKGYEYQKGRYVTVEPNGFGEIAR